MDAFCAQVMAFRTVVPSTEGEQWQQATSLAGMLLKISPVHKDNLRQLANSLQIAAEPRQHLLRKIELLKEGGDHLWQDWTFIQHYVTENLVSCWTSAEVAGAPMDTLVQHVVNWVQMLGLRKPNQSTFQVITCLILIMRDGSAWPSIQKKELFDLVKMHFKRIGAIQVPGIYIANLPVPANLRDLVPEGWWVANLGAEYTACNFVRYDDLSFDRVRLTIPMRNTRTDVRDTRSPRHMNSFGAQPGAQPGAQLPADMMQGFVQVMMQNMAHAADRRQPAMLAVPQPLALMPPQPLALMPPAAPQPLALMPPEPAVGEVQEVVADGASVAKAAGVALMPPGPASVAKAAGVHGEVQPMTLQDVAAVLGAVPSEPVAKMKRPAAAPNKMKRPAAAHTAVKKKPTSSAHTAKPPVPGWTDAQRMAAYPNGCPRCRKKPLCTPSCFRGRGECE